MSDGDDDGVCVGGGGVAGVNSNDVVGNVGGSGGVAIDVDTDGGVCVSDGDDDGVCVGDDRRNDGGEGVGVIGSVAASAAAAAAATAAAAAAAADSRRFYSAANADRSQITAA